MLSNADVITLNLFAHQIRRAFPDARIWAFGSRVKGNASWESDLMYASLLKI